MEKSPEAFRTIREVADAMDLPQHVLRFWETRFPQIRPLKRAGGRRYYRPDDVERLRLIKRLLYDEGYTIKGVQKLFKEQGVNALASGEFEPRARLQEALEGGPAQGHLESIGPAGPRSDAAFANQEADQVSSRLQAEDIVALHVALDEIREAERILAQARAKSD